MTENTKKRSATMGVGAFLKSLFMVDAIREGLKAAVQGTISSQTITRTILKEKTLENDVEAIHFLAWCAQAGIISKEQRRFILSGMDRLRSERQRFWENVCIYLSYSQCETKKAGATVTATSPATPAPGAPGASPTSTAAVGAASPATTPPNDQSKDTRVALVKMLAECQTDAELDELLRLIGAKNPYPYGAADAVKEYAIHNGIPAAVAAIQKGWREAKENRDRVVQSGGVFLQRGAAAASRVRQSAADAGRGTAGKLKNGGAVVSNGTRVAVDRVAVVAREQAQAARKPGKAFGIAMAIVVVLIVAGLVYLGFSLFSGMARLKF